MEGELGAWVNHLMETYGLWTVFVLIFLESSGVPLPGETALVAASIYAATPAASFTLWEIIAVATAAAVLGDTMGFFIGRKLGLPLLERWGAKYPAVGKRVAVGEYMFLKHGGKIVFLGRWVALLRVLAAVLAGANKMPWRRFAVMNALGGICWATFFATLAYAFGSVITQVEGPLGYGLLALTILGLVTAFILFRRYEHRIIEHAFKEIEAANAKKAAMTSIPAAEAGAA